MTVLKKIVVTGALGHIGSDLIRELPSTFPEAHIVLVDNLATQRYCSLFGLPDSGRYTFVEADVVTADLSQIVEAADAVIHLAAITNAAGSFEIQDQVERVNFVGTERVAGACLANGAKLIFVSTTSVYGKQSTVVDEDCPESDLQPQSPYALSKLRAEQLLTSLGAEGLDFVTCRFGTIFGASVGMRFHTAVNKFVWQAVMKQPITVWRSAVNQRRPYLDLGDGVRALTFILLKGLFDRRIYNVLTINATVADVLDTLREIVPDLRIEEVDAKIMNQLSYTVSNDRFAAHGFQPRGELRTAIRDTVAWLQAANSG